MACLRYATESFTAASVGYQFCEIVEDGEGKPDSCVVLPVSFEEDCGKNQFACLSSKTMSPAYALRAATAAGDASLELSSTCMLVAELSEMMAEDDAFNGL